eukprot:NODE_1575_length_1123_cov_472.540037_g1283_i0.p2 GENE.NODE_1575_length_1123_cov_472.540037_g1283_i0~~NODE_1575_length_1123_cov_472.540037_g1283_i0.p2  ORF type:complete len:116 (-),score=38.13 NODE_1575_length_1123_cov_472.540037_g1283_i0:97-444(-)
MIEKKHAKLVLIAHDVEPLELIIWMPALCRKLGVPYAIVKNKGRLGTFVNAKKTSCVCLTDVRPEDQTEFDKLLESVKISYNERFSDLRKHWGGLKASHKTMEKARKRKEKAAKK